MRILSRSLRDPTIGDERGRRYDIRDQRPELECLAVMTNYNSFSEEARWLLNWCPDSDAYPASRLEIMRLATWWRVRFRDMRDGKWRTVHVPLKGTPPPPGWREGK
jgi:hypothetical protein